jgi:hypothetical protein
MKVSNNADYGTELVIVRVVHCMESAWQFELPYDSPGVRMGLRQRRIHSSVPIGSGRPAFMRTD